jgi:hypothetical protein
MLVPVFVSSPTLLNPQQETVYRLIFGELGRVGLQTRTLGRTDYPSKFPLREVYTLARHCAGGVILGFSQFLAPGGVSKRGTIAENKVKHQVVFPSAWNQLEAGVLFALGKPLLVLRDHGIEGGIFDNGVTDLFVQPMPKIDLRGKDRKAFQEVMQKFASDVHSHYYSV